jgi:hypothetical protein
LAVVRLDPNRVCVEVAGGDLFPGLAADGSTPLQGAMRHEEQGRLALALQRLLEKQRQVFQLRMQEGPAVVSFPCPACGKLLKAKAELAGKKVKCSGGGKPVLVRESKQVVSP